MFEPARRALLAVGGLSEYWSGIALASRRCEAPPQIKRCVCEVSLGEPTSGMDGVVDADSQRLERRAYRGVPGSVCCCKRSDVAPYLFPSSVAQVNIVQFNVSAGPA